MSDPLDRLRSSSPVDVPSVDAIKSRARRTQQRRYALVASSSLLVLVLAGIGLFVRTNPSRTKAHSTTTLASEPVRTPSPAPQGSALSAQAPAPESYGSAAAGSSDADATKAAPVASGFFVQTIATKHVPGEDFTLRVCNGGSSAVTRSFPTTERYDFVVTAPSGVEVWKWSAGQAFPDVVTSEMWGPKECKTWTAHWDGKTSSGAPAAPGSYEVMGSLTSSPRQNSEQIPFCLNVCS